MRQKNAVTTEEFCRYRDSLSQLSTNWSSSQEKKKTLGNWGITQAIYKLVHAETHLRTDPISTKTMVLATPAVVPQTATHVFPFAGSSTYVFKGKGNNVRRYNNKKSLLICNFCKNKGHYVEACYTCQGILQNIASLT